MEKLTFRLATKGDIKAFEDIREEDLHNLHLERISKQKEKKAEYFIVFLRNQPVGHVFINYDNKGYLYTILEDIYVKKQFRKKGIAKKIVFFAERHLKQRGQKEIGLEADIENKWLNKFYEDLGYKRISGPHKNTYILKDKGNKELVEVVYRLKKSLKYLNFA